jgi:hypothetical protein
MKSIFSLDLAVRNIDLQSMCLARLQTVETQQPKPFGAGRTRGTARCSEARFAHVSYVFQKSIRLSEKRDTAGPVRAGWSCPFH